MLIDTLSQQVRIKTAVLFGEGWEIQKRRGILVALTYIVIRVQRALLSRTIFRPRERRSSHIFFDTLHNVDTIKKVSVEEMLCISSNHLHAEPYGSMDPSVLRGILSALSKTLPINYKDFTFLDIGSGKGTALLVASEFPFQKIVGIEFAKNLHRIALNNIKNYKNQTQKGENIEMLLEDAVNYIFPSERLIIYFFNPFDETIMTRVLANIERRFMAHHHEIIILYCRPICASLFEAKPFLKKVSFNYQGMNVYRSTIKS